MTVDHLPVLLHELSLMELFALLVSAFVGFAVFPLLKRRKVRRLGRAVVLGTAVLLFLCTLSSILAELYLPLMESGGYVASGFAAALNDFYHHPAGLLLGAAGLAALKGTALIFPLGILLLLLRTRVRQRYRKRCSNCHYIFPEHTQPYQHCPRCGAYWQYEK